MISTPFHSQGDIWKGSPISGYECINGLGSCGWFDLLEYYTSIWLKNSKVRGEKQFFVGWWRVHCVDHFRYRVYLVCKISTSLDLNSQFMNLNMNIKQDEWEISFYYLISFYHFLLTSPSASLICRRMSVPPSMYCVLMCIDRRVGRLALRIHNVFDLYSQFWWMPAF